MTGLSRAPGPLPAPAEGQEGRPSALLFREAMSRVVTAVHVITSDGPAGLAGLTATAVSSVSDDPASLLVCVNSASPSAGRMVENGVFAVSVLAGEQRPMAELFSGRTGQQGEARFAHGGWRRDTSGLPAVDGALAVFSCRLADSRVVATHWILIGEVTAIALGPDASGLVYARRHYGVYPASK